MFPLGSVLLPAMPLALRVFEPRYLTMLVEVLERQPAEFGVVLIERGQEVGGGDQRFGIGTVARVVEIEQGDGVIGLLARGAQRIEVVRWGAEEPYPVAEVRELPALAWDAAQQPALDRVERAVRTALVVASEYVETPWPADIELETDPVNRCWQLAGITPVGLLDRMSFLRSKSVAQLLERVAQETEGAVEMMRAGWSDDGLRDGTGPGAL